MLSNVIHAGMSDRRRNGMNDIRVTSAIPDSRTGTLAPSA